jgi:hypothetical protein
MVRPAPGFAGLFRAQARGDGLALAEKGRRVLTVELAEPLEAAIASLATGSGLWGADQAGSGRSTRSSDPAKYRE